MDEKLTIKEKINKFLIGLVVTIVVFIVYRAMHPSYLPKGSIARTPVPGFEYVEGKIEDKQRKPLSGEERDERRKEAYKEPLPFKQ
jgi:hypothetical protein